LNLSAPGERIRFQISDSTEEPDVEVDEGDTSTTLTMVSRPSLLIPDDDPAGVMDSISIAKMGQLAEIKIDVDVVHSYIGDVTIALLAPDGQEFLLRNKGGGNADDLRVSYDSKDSGSPLNALKGAAITGDWQLKVCDLAGADTGKLRSWAMTVSYQATGGHFSGQEVAGIQIPDNDPSGITSVISVPDSGMMKKGKVVMELDHSYHGDLEVILVAPSGRQSNVITRNSLGAAGGKLTKSVSLNTFIADEYIQGDWQLLVRDTWEVDKGTLDRWSLELDY
jgi:subtilisin-like proprotein convertase family protein